MYLISLSAFANSLLPKNRFVVDVMNGEGHLTDGAQISGGFVH